MLWLVSGDPKSDRRCLHPGAAKACGYLINDLALQISVLRARWPVPIVDRRCHYSQSSLNLRDVKDRSFA